MAHKFLRDDGWFQLINPTDVGINSTTTTTGLFTSFVTHATSNTTLIGGAYLPVMSVAQGSTGVWYATAYLSCNATAVSTFFIRLSDGTTGSNLVASIRQDLFIASDVTNVSVSGIITNPSSNIQVTAATSTAGAAANAKISSNITGDALDSGLTVFRIG